MDEQNSNAERIHRLMMLHLDGTATPEDQHEIARLLSEGGAQLQFIEEIQDAASLRWWSLSASPESIARDAIMPASQTVERPKLAQRDWRAAGAVLVASITGILFAAGWLYSKTGQGIAGDVPSSTRNAATREQRTGHSPSNEVIAPGAEGVATVTRLRAVQWDDKALVTKELSRLKVGQSLRFERGEAEIIFDRAVQLVVRGPAEFEIRSSKEIYSPYGAIAARVGEAGKGFVIQTPSGRITDLGTEFGVSINKKGRTDVAVFRGAVDLSYGPRASKVHPSVSRRLVQGQALRLDSHGHMRRLVTVDGARFPNIYGGYYFIDGRESTIFTEVRDNIRDGVEAKFYRIVPGGLQEDVPAYVDRQHEWNGVDSRGIPEVLLGADYIMPFNEDKYLPTFEVTLTIARPAVLFVFLSDIASEPKWLSDDFVNTGMQIGLDETAEFSNPRYRLAVGPGEAVDTQFSVWKREVHGPTSITLGSVKQGKKGWGFCMYGIAAIPLDVAEERVR